MSLVDRPNSRTKGPAIGRRLDEGKWKLCERRLAEFRANSSTVTRFCQDADVSPKTFYYWMRRLNAKTAWTKRLGSSKPRRRRAAVPHAGTFVPTLTSVIRLNPEKEAAAGETASPSALGKAGKSPADMKGP